MNLSDLFRSILEKWLMPFAIALAIVVLASYATKCLRQMDDPPLGGNTNESNMNASTCLVDWATLETDDPLVNDIDEPSLKAPKLLLERESRIMELLVILTLHESCVSGDDFILRRLADLDAIHRIPCINMHFSYPVASRNTTNATAIMAASKLGHAHIVKLLLLHPQIDVNHAEAEFGITALMTACYTNRLAVVRILLRVPNIDYNHQGMLGWTALLGACTNSNAEVVQELLGMPNIDVNAADDEGFTALIWAVRNNNLEIVKMMLAHPETDANAQTNFGVTAHKLAKLKGYRKIQAVLEISEKLTNEL